MTIQDPMRAHERERAAKLIDERWMRVRSDYYDTHSSEPLDERLDQSVERAKERILSGTEEFAEGAGLVLAERQRAVAIIANMFFEAWDAVADDGFDDYPEALPESINGACRDILGEHVPSELFEDPGALIEAKQNLGITQESQKLPNGGYEIRWSCATCGRAGEWVPSFLNRSVDDEHAANHTVVQGS